jgi:hypothetical protein
MQEGAIEFRDVTMAYRADLPPVLRGLSFKVNQREKVGTCRLSVCIVFVLSLYCLCIVPQPARVGSRRTGLCRDRSGARVETPM